MTLPISNPQSPSQLRRLRLQAALTRHGWPYLPYAATGDPDVGLLLEQLDAVGVHADGIDQDRDGTWRVQLGDGEHHWTASAFSRANAISEAATIALEALPGRVASHTRARPRMNDVAGARRG